jgi:hypothetical protein
VKALLAAFVVPQANCPGMWPESGLFLLRRIVAPTV